MKFPLLMQQVLAIGVVATMGLPLADVTWAQADAGGPAVINPIVDEVAQVKATELGIALLSRAKWKVARPDPGHQIWWPMVAAGQSLYCMEYSPSSARTLSLDLQSGHIRWESKPNTALPRVAPSAFAFSDDSLEVLHDRVDQLLLAHFSKDTGERSIVWQFPNAPTVRAPAAGLDPMVIPHAAFAGDQVIVDGNSQSGGGGTMFRHVVIPMSICSLDRKTGAPQWATKIDGGAAYTSQPLVVAGKVFVTVDQSVYPDFEAEIPNGVQSQKSHIEALNVKDGKVLWQTPSIDARQSAPVVAGQLLLAATEKGAVLAYDAQTGKEKWHVTLTTGGKVAATSLETQDSQLLLNKDQLLVPVNAPNEYQVDRTVKKNWILGAFATVDIQTGRQTGYFGGFSRQMVNPFNTTILDVHGDTIFAFVRGPASGGALWCEGINRKTLQLECFMPNVGSATISNDVLYMGTRPSQANNALATIYAVPLAAWDEVKAGAAKP